MQDSKNNKAQSGKPHRRVTSSVLILFVLICVFLWQAPRVLYPLLMSDVFESEVNKRRQSYYTGVITIWQIDTFEGGTGSRTAWLNKTLSALERNYNGVYITVRSVPVEQARLMLSSNDFSILPDMISFGGGVITEPEKLFISLQENVFAPLRPDVRAAAGSYAVPWCYGAYALLMDSALAAKHIKEEKSLENVPQALNGLGGPVKYGRGTRDIYALGIAGNGNVNYAEAISRIWPKGSLNGKYALKSYDKDINFSVWDAYNNSKSLCAMIGTQRDLYRLITAESQSKSRATEIFPITGYTDLIQCIGIVKTTDDKKLEIMQNILGYLLQTGTQERLNEIGMFPTAIAAQAQIQYNDPRVQQLFEAVSKEEFAVGNVYEGHENVLRRTEAKINELKN